MVVWTHIISFTETFTTDTSQSPSRGNKESCTTLDLIPVRFERFLSFCRKLLQSFSKRTETVIRKRCKCRTRDVSAKPYFDPPKELIGNLRTGPTQQNRLRRKYTSFDIQTRKVVLEPSLRARLLPYYPETLNYALPSAMGISRTQHNNIIIHVSVTPAW